MQMMVKLMGAKKGIEVGTFTGFSALCFALSLPSDGQLDCLDIDKESVDVGVPFFEEAGVADIIKFERVCAVIESPTYQFANQLLAWCYFECLEGLIVPA